jgi:hypothetical protein
VGSARQRAVLDEPGGAALAHPAEQLVELEPEQRDEGLVAGVGQVRSPALAAGAEHPVLVDPDDRADRGALGRFEAGESPVEVGGTEALLSEQGPSFGAVRRVEPIARSLEQVLHLGAPRSAGRRTGPGDPVDGAAALGAGLVGADLAGARGLDREPELLLERAADRAADGVVQIRGVPWVAPAMVRLWLLDQYDDAELDRKKVAAMFAGFVTRPGADDVMGEDGAQKDADGAALVGLQPGTMQLLLPGEDIKLSDPADVGGSYEAFQYRTLLACCAAMGVPYTNVTGDLRQANYSSLREGKLEFRKRIEQFQHGTLVFQLCRAVWQRWLRDAVLADALELPGFAENPVRYFAVKWIPPKWDWVDPLKDRKAEIEAIEAGLKSRSDVIESEGYDAEEVDRRIAADHAREQELGLKFGRPATSAAEPAAEVDPEERERPNQSEEQAA